MGSIIKKTNIKMAKFEKQLFNQKIFFWHDTSSCTCSVYVYLSIVSVKALVQVISLYMHKQNPYLKANRKKKWLISQSCYFVKNKKIFLASNFFMRMFNKSILCRQSIELFRHKL